MIGKGDEELVDLVEMELTELLESKGYKDVPIIRGSALKALEGDPEYVKGIEELMRVVDEKILFPICTNTNKLSTHHSPSFFSGCKKNECEKTKQCSHRLRFSPYQQD